jgi:phospholipid/cholesterol/gamma-HCH transport system permease protein
VRKLVVPRILAGTIMMPVLTVIADAVGIAGGAVISQYQLKVATSIYWNNVIMGLTMDDVWMGLIKPVVLGFAVMSIGCFVGLRTTGGTQGVGRAATMAVVGGSVAVLTADFLITKLMITLLY